jgi:predicted ATPase
MLIGRQREIGRLDEVLELTGGGRGGLCVLCGEPGIGKTRLADDMVAHATARGFVSSWGRAWETGGAPAYWPWIELLEPLAAPETELPPRVNLLLGGKAGAAVGEGTRADPARERFELFEAVASFLRACARKQPLLLVFDDLHAADIATLELLAFVARGLRTARIAIVCTWRDAEARFPRVADLLARIGREGDTLWLCPLSSEEVAELIRQETGRSDCELSAAIHGLSDGNPLFIREMVHALHASRMAVPRLDQLRSAGALDSVLSLVRGRLAGAGDELRALLEVAAAIGRESELALLAEAAGKTPAETCALLEEATARGLMMRRSDARWAFAHALVREAFYLELSAEKRHTLHHAITLALMRRVPGEPSAVEASEAVVSTLAHHALAALPLGDPSFVLRTACRAAAHARAQLAYEEATALLERTLAICSEYPIQEAERGELALALGWAATEAGKIARGRELFREAAKIARCTGDATLLARAALGEGAQYVLAEVRTELLDALREALHALGDREGDEVRRLRARVLARLSAALTPSDTPDEPLALARQALAMAEGEIDARTRSTSMSAWARRLPTSHRPPSGSW